MTGAPPPTAPDRADHGALALMARETHLRPGKAPDGLNGTLGPSQWQREGDEFLFRSDDGHRFLYRRGAGVIVDSAADADQAALELWFNGTVYAAIASMNGLVPVHASAVVHEGRVHAFNGPSGAGKSTLAAALAQEGLPLFCDDTLILDFSDPDRIWALPGHKRLKLSETAIAWTGAAQEEDVGAGTGKFYARAPGDSFTQPLPLAEFVILSEGDEPTFIRTAPAERIALLDDDHYTADLHSRLSGLDRPARFALLARIASQVEVVRFVRPMGGDRFAAGVRTAAAHIRGERPA